MSEMKQVVVIRRDLQLTAGKAVAQGGHAFMGALCDARERWGSIASDMLDPWREEGKPKIVLGVDSSLELLELALRCEEKNIGYYLVRDAGLTEVSPLTPTALGIGPDSSRHIDQITGHLRLY